ncbi:MAG: restriction endonuclease [Acidimicrobiia bacterium]|nr:restriction endonuclease [Acidimicrobiia bacterium]MXZ86984.1 restriction endonuclease [Acidimicrobiia bacterium]MYE73538.1 restriction endonuclease [Acidimicrobiia bacterium]MYG72770.1 restriction endonuclease [Acidimicrobiia bacterium]MYJ62569.1 restriction endonuclease [Acidimicrobiia bacterium]
MTESSPAWLVRSGGRGESEDFALENGFAAGGGFNEIPDLTEVATREEVKEIVRNAFPDSSPRTVSNYTSQLWAMRCVKPDDLIVLPLKTTSQIALGTVKDGYKFRNDEDLRKRHVISVNWQRTDVPRTAVKQDLLYSLGAAQTVCQITRNDGAWRLHQIMQTGVDPGARNEAVEAIAGEDIEATDASESTFDLERIGRDQIQAFVAEQFAGHDLAKLVAAVLSAEGFFTQVASPGPDGGIDIFAGAGPLGLDTPRLIVQVKSSPAPVNATVVRELHGVLSTHGADQALLVAWGGVNKVARQELRSQFFRVRVWDAEDLLNAVLRNYEQFSEEFRADLPLKRIWTLVEE